MFEALQECLSEMVTQMAGATDDYRPAYELTVKILVARDVKVEILLSYSFS